MYSNNKGSILIFTLIIFSIISIITMMCIGLNYSNNNLFKLEYKETLLKEKSLSGIEIASSNILKEVETAVLTTNSEQEFYNYFLGNNFLDNIQSISSDELKNVSINPSILPTYESGFIKFNIVSTSVENKYTNQVQASIKIKNPFLGLTTTDNSDNNAQINKEEEINIQTIKSNINYKDIILIYNYKEI